MSRMAYVMAELCGNCDKEFDTCGKDVNECLREHEANLVDKTYEAVR